jgi:hypothetical protein
MCKEGRRRGGFGHARLGVIARRDELVSTLVLVQASVTRENDAWWGKSLSEGLAFDRRLFRVTSHACAQSRGRNESVLVWCSL